MSGLWTWAVDNYGRPGVARACLELQDHRGQNVCLLLWAAWGGGEGANLAPAAKVARRWDETVLGDLRALRRNLKSPAPLIEDAGREALRRDIKAAELRAERLLLEALERMTGGPPSPGPVIEALAAAAEAWGNAPPRAAFATLAAALEVERA